MAQETNKAQDQTVLYATGEDSPDMIEFRRRMHIELAARELISAIGNLCAQKFYETQALNELAEEVRAVSEGLRGINEGVGGINYELTTTRNPAGRLANNIDAIADGLLTVINGDGDLHVTGAMQVENDCLGNLERIADNLSTEDGFSAAEALDGINDNVDRLASKIETIADNIRDDDGRGIGESLSDIRTIIGCACNPDDDTQIKVSVDGDVMNHPY